MSNLQRNTWQRGSSTMVMPRQNGLTLNTNSLKQQTSGLTLSCLRDDVPVEISRQLYIGSSQAALNRDVLHRCGITHIVAISSRACGLHRQNFQHVDQHDNKIEFAESPKMDAYDISGYYANEFAYLNVALADNEQADLLGILPITTAFISDGVRRGRVLVHCSAGRSRSPSVAIGYLLGVGRFKSFSDAYAHIQQCRPGAQINRGFIQQLKLYAENIQRSLWVPHQTFDLIRPRAQLSLPTGISCYIRASESQHLMHISQTSDRSLLMGAGPNQMSQGVSPCSSFTQNTSTGVCATDTGNQFSMLSIGLGSRANGNTVQCTHSCISSACTKHAAAGNNKRVSLTPHPRPEHGELNHSMMSLNSNKRSAHVCYSISQLGDILASWRPTKRTVRVTDNINTYQRRAHSAQPRIGKRTSSDSKHNDSLDTLMHPEQYQVTHFIHFGVKKRTRKRSYSIAKTGAVVKDSDQHIPHVTQLSEQPSSSTKTVRFAPQSFSTVKSRPCTLQPFHTNSTSVVSVSAQTGSFCPPGRLENASATSFSVTGQSIQQFDTTADDQSLLDDMDDPAFGPAPLMTPRYSNITRHRTSTASNPHASSSYLTESGEHNPIYPTNSVNWCSSGMDRQHSNTSTGSGVPPALPRLSLHSMNDSDVRTTIHEPTSAPHNVHRIPHTMSGNKFTDHDTSIGCTSSTYSQDFGVMNPSSLNLDISPSHTTPSSCLAINSKNAVSQYLSKSSLNTVPTQHPETAVTSFTSSQPLRVQASSQPTESSTAVPTTHRVPSYASPKEHLKETIGCPDSLPIYSGAGSTLQNSPVPLIVHYSASESDLQRDEETFEDVKSDKPSSTRTRYRGTSSSPSVHYSRFMKHPSKLSCHLQSHRGTVDLPIQFLSQHITAS